LKACDALEHPWIEAAARRPAYHRQRLSIEVLERWLAKPLLISVAQLAEHNLPMLTLLFQDQPPDAEHCAHEAVVGDLQFHPLLDFGSIVTHRAQRGEPALELIQVQTIELAQRTRKLGRERR
jgi:hypothetical protein